jgi:hypothetical protein
MVTDVNNDAPRSCAHDISHFEAQTDLPSSQVRAALGGHLPAQIPVGFGLQQVDRLEPGDGGYAAWTDSRCRRINVWFDRGSDSVGNPARPAFGPWIQLQRCGDPRPCIVYQAGLTDGVVTFSTWQLPPRVATAVLRTVQVTPT